MARTFRVIDSGIREGRFHIAFDQALIDLHREGRIPDTIRFLRFPKTVLVGRHQALSREVRLDYCRRKGFGVGRRITGGGAIYLDPGQLGWELVFHRDTLPFPTLADLARGVCEAAASGLRRLGVAARFRPRNDIEVEGQKVGGTGGFFDGDTLFYQGTLLVDCDAEEMVRALCVPEDKLARRKLDSAAQRVVTLQDLLGEETPDTAAIQRALLDGFAGTLGIEPRPGAISDEEEATARRLFEEEIGTEEFVRLVDEPAEGDDLLSAVRTAEGGTIRAFVRLEGAGRGRVREVLLTGDFFVAPPRVVFDLEAALRGIPAAEAGAAIERFFATARVDSLTLAPADFRAAIEEAIATGARLPAATPFPGSSG